jgi:Cdc6-like AAA superfamily ATPase
MIPPKVKKHKELKPEELRWKCDPEIFEFASTSDIEPIEGILGQERALKALRLGVELKGPGYNIYMAGLSGSGKATSVKQMLKVIGSTCPEVFDYAYVNNFQDSDRPMLLVFPKGKAKFFKRALHSEHSTQPSMCSNRKSRKHLKANDTLKRRKILFQYTVRKKKN